MKTTNSACCVVFALYPWVCGLMLPAQNVSFHGAPPSAKDLAPPSTGDSAENGKPLYERYCASCHGADGQGSGNVPSLTTATIKSTSPGELFWFISRGDPNDGMPSWAQLAETQRWQIVSYLKTSRPFGAAAPAHADAELLPGLRLHRSRRLPTIDSKNLDRSTRSR